MSQDESKPGRTRRRFLADMLFLGGTVTAASLLAKSTLFREESPAVEPTPVKTPEPVVPPNEPMPGQMVMPEGDYVEPKPETVPTQCEEPMIEGRRVMPEPNPAGGAMPVQMPEQGK